MFRHHVRMPRRDRQGVSVVFAVLCLFALISVAALAIDVGYVYNAHAELQRAADSAALAACWHHACIACSAGPETGATAAWSK